ncbi:hypothetical protein AAAC51_20835 [Priestia megaterium]
MFLSFLIGLLFWWTENLYVTIFTHFLIDFYWACRYENQKGICTARRINSVKVKETAVIFNTPT